MLNVRIFDPARPSSRTRGESSLRTGEGGNGITPGNGVSPIRHSRNQAPVMNLGAARPFGTRESRDLDAVIPAKAGIHVFRAARHAGYRRLARRYLQIPANEGAAP